MSRAVRPLFALIALVILTSGCAPDDDDLELPAAPDHEVEDAEAAGRDVIGAPDAGLPTTLDDLRARAEPEALAWQDDPRLAEIIVEFGGSSVSAAELSYLAPDSDRLLSVAVGGDGVTPTALSLLGFGLDAIDDFSIDAIPPLPLRALEPHALAEAGRDALRACGIRGEVASVVYASGAPWSWTGTAWEPRPSWRATIRTEQAGAVVLGVDGDAVSDGGCVEDVTPPEIDVDSVLDP